MKRILAIVVFTILSANIVLHAQELTNAEQRRINLRVLKAIEQYERNATLYDEEQVYMFRELFPSDSTRIVLDLIGVRNYMSKVTVREYMDVIAATTFGVDQSLYNVKKGRMTFVDGVWKIPVTCQKTVSYIDGNSIFFSTDEFYEGQKFDYTLNLVYDPVADVCQIASIDAVMDSPNVFPKDRFYILQKKDVMSPKEKRREARMFEYNNLEYNNFDQVFIGQSELKAWHRDVKVKKIPSLSADNYDMISLKYNKVKWRAKVRYAHTWSDIGAFYPLKNDPNIKVASGAKEIGVDLGRSALVGKGGSLSYYVGAGLAESTVNFSRGEFNYSYATFDPATGTSYTREYNVESVKEDITYTDIVVPAYLSWDPEICKWMQWSFTVGAKFYFNKNVDASPLVIDGKVTYIKNGKECSVNLGPYSAFLSPSMYSSQMSYSLVGGFEVNINPFRRHVYLHAKVSYEYGIGNYHDSDKKIFYNEENEEKVVYPFVYSARKDSDVAVRSFLDCVDLQRRALWFEAGFMFKF